MTTEDRIAWFFRQMWAVFCDGGSLDGFELMATIERSGLATWIAATAEQAKAGDGDVKEGDPLLQLTPEARAVISAAAVREIADV